MKEWFSYDTVSRTNHGILRRKKKICVIVADLYPSLSYCKPWSLVPIWLNWLFSIFIIKLVSENSLPMHSVLTNGQRCLLSRNNCRQSSSDQIHLFPTLELWQFYHSSACRTVNTGTKQPIRHFYEWWIIESWNCLESTFYKIFSGIWRTRRTLGPLYKCVAPTVLHTYRNKGDWLRISNIIST